jgi:hypothetical protein
MSTDDASRVDCRSMSLATGETDGPRCSARSRSPSTSRDMDSARADASSSIAPTASANASHGGEAAGADLVRHGERVLLSSRLVRGRGQTFGGCVRIRGRRGVEVSTSRDDHHRCRHRGAIVSVTHCPWCRPCCCVVCNPWEQFIRSWAGLALAIRNPGAAMWLVMS